MQEISETQVWSLEGSYAHHIPPMLVCSLNQQGPLGDGMAAHFNILAWSIPWTEKPGRWQSIGLQRVGHDWSDWACSTNMGLQISLQENYFISSRYTPRSGINGSCGSAIFNFLRDILLFFIVAAWIYIPTNNAQEVIISWLLLIAILSGVRWYLIVILIFISLIISNVVVLL